MKPQPLFVPLTGAFNKEALHHYGPLGSLGEKYQGCGIYDVAFWKQNRSNAAAVRQTRGAAYTMKMVGGEREDGGFFCGAQVGLFPAFRRVHWKLRKHSAQVLCIFNPGNQLVLTGEPQLVKSISRKILKWKKVQSPALFRTISGQLKPGSESDSGFHH